MSSGSRDEGAVFSALADRTRREVIRCLAEEGSLTPTQLAARLPVTRQAVSKHLAMLDDAGLVTVSQQGRETLYRLTPEPLTQAMSWIAEMDARWDERLDALRQHLERRTSV